MTAVLFARRTWCWQHRHAPHELMARTCHECQGGEKSLHQSQPPTIHYSADQSIILSIPSRTHLMKRSGCLNVKLDHFKIEFIDTASKHSATRVGWTWLWFWLPSECPSSGTFQSKGHQHFIRRATSCLAECPTEVYPEVETGWTAWWMRCCLGELWESAGDDISWCNGTSEQHSHSNPIGIEPNELRLI